MNATLNTIGTRAVVSTGRFAVVPRKGLKSRDEEAIHALFTWNVNVCASISIVTPTQAGIAHIFSDFGHFVHGPKAIRAYARENCELFLSRFDDLYNARADIYGGYFAHLKPIGTTEMMRYKNLMNNGFSSEEESEFMSDISGRMTALSSYWTNNETLKAMQQSSCKIEKTMFGSEQSYTGYIQLESGELITGTEADIRPITKGTQVSLPEDHLQRLRPLEYPPAHKWTNFPTWGAIKSAQP